MLIDNPHVLRSVVEETGAHPTHPGAESLVTSLAPKIDEYARRLAEYIRKEDEAEASVAKVA